MSIPAESRVISISYAAFKRGLGVLDITFSLVLKEKDLNSTDIITFEVSNPVTTKIVCPNFSITAPEDIDNFVVFAMALHARICDKVYNIEVNAKPQVGQYLSSIMIRGMSSIYNSAESSLDQLPYSFKYTHVIGDKLSYADIAATLSAQLAANLHYSDMYSTEEEIAYMKQHKYSELHRRRADLL